MKERDGIDTNRVGRDGANRVGAGRVGANRDGAGSGDGKPNWDDRIAEAEESVEAEEARAGEESSEQAKPVGKRGRKKDNTAPALSTKEFLRFIWTQLTSMRTALTLLFIAALAAVPGSLIPQRTVSPVQVSQFISERPTLGGFYDKVGLFEVYTSPWFSAIYLLLLVSLVGCIVPRIGVYYRALRAQPPATPRRLTRLPVSGSVQTTQEPESVLDGAEGFLRSKRFRVRREGNAISAERGYLREAGNLVFHVSLVFILFGVAIGALFGYRGNSIVVVGQGFSNNLTQYDELTSGARFTDLNLKPFSVIVKDFDVSFETGAVNTGQPREFKIGVDVIEKPGAAPYSDSIEVNHPLELKGGQGAGTTQVHLLGHGYSPNVTVRDGQGNVAWSGPVNFLPQDGNFTSSGVINAVDARPQRIAFEGFFLPTATVDQKGPRSVFPDAYNPELFLTAYHGDPKVENGVPSNVYSLDKTGLTQFQVDGEPLRTRLKPGATIELPDGQGSLTFEGYQRWVRLQVSHTPGTAITLGAILIGVTGLSLSLFIRPRRLWLRVRPGTAGPDGAAGMVSVVEVAGLDKADARTGLYAETEELAGTLDQELIVDEEPAGDRASTEPAKGGLDQPATAEDDDSGAGDDATKEDS